MIFLFRTFIFFTFVFWNARAESSGNFAVKYPYGLLTAHYGVLLEDDLAIDAWREKPKPFEKDGFNGGYSYWQCFPTKNVTARYGVWRDNDPMGRSDVVVNLCSFEFEVKQRSSTHIYVGRRAELLEVCRTRAKAWKKLVQNQKHVCLNGYGGELEKERSKNRNKPKQIWIWDRIKTEFGCMSYFDGECELSYWEKQGYRPSAAHTNR